MKRGINKMKNRIDKKYIILHLLKFRIHIMLITQKL